MFSCTHRRLMFGPAYRLFTQLSRPFRLVIRLTVFNVVAAKYSNYYKFFLLRRFNRVRFSLLSVGGTWLMPGAIASKSGVLNLSDHFRPMCRPKVLARVEWRGDERFRLWQTD